MEHRGVWAGVSDKLTALCWTTSKDRVKIYFLEVFCWSPLGQGLRGLGCYFAAHFANDEYVFLCFIVCLHAPVLRWQLVGFTHMASVGVSHLPDEVMNCRFGTTLCRNKEFRWFCCGKKGIDYAVCGAVLAYFMFDALAGSGSISCVFICRFASCNELGKGEVEG